MAIRPEVKKQVVEAVLEGQSIEDAQTGAGIRVNERSVYRWVEKYKAAGEEGLQDRRAGVAWKVTEELRAWIVEACEDTPTISARELQEQVEETFGIEISLSRLNQIRRAEQVSRRDMRKKNA